jgi:hypothetical protein
LPQLVQIWRAQHAGSCSSLAKMHS